MIYRVHVVVLRAVPEEFSNAVAYAFGINALDPAQAVSMAVAAAKDAFGRDADYIGGIVIEADCRCASKAREDTPTRVRLLCSVCGHWAEVSNAGLMYSFMEGLDMFSREGQEAKKALSAAGPFVSRHLSECSATIEGIHEDDPRWLRLGETKREDKHVR